MWAYYTDSMTRMWHHFEKIYGYHEVLSFKESVERWSIFFLGVILMYFVDYWFYKQRRDDQIIEGLSAMKDPKGGQIYTNPHNLIQYTDSKIGIVYLKIYPKRPHRPYYPKLSRTIVYIIFTLLIIFTVLGFLTTTVQTLPYDNLRHVF